MLYNFFFFEYSELWIEKSYLSYTQTRYNYFHSLNHFTINQIGAKILIISKHISIKHSIYSYIHYYYIIFLTESLYWKCSLWVFSLFNFNLNQINIYNQVNICIHINYTLELKIKINIFFHCNQSEFHSRDLFPAILKF